MNRSSGEEAWSLERLLSTVVGSGPRTADDMTADQARGAFHRLLDGTSPDTTVGAFLLANRWKENTPTELAAFLDVMRERSVRIAEPSVDPVDCGANYDGKHDTALLGVAAGIVAAAAGTPVVVHSADRVPTKHGDTYKHVLDALGVPTDLPPAASASMVDEVGFGYYYARRFNTGLHGLLERREEMGVRTFLNTIETLANPANASVHLGSFFHLSFAERVIDTLLESSTTAVERILMVQGLEGYDDIRLGSTNVAEWISGAQDDYTIRPEDFGISFESSDLEVDDVAADSARLTERIIEGKAGGDFAEVVALNAGIRIYARGDADSIEEGAEVARSAMDDGSAMDVLDRLRHFAPTD